MRTHIAFIGALLLANVLPAWAQQFQVGDQVHSTMSGFKPQNPFAQSGSFGAVTAQNSSGQPGGKAPGPTGSAGKFPVGAQVEFDRVEGSQPQLGRWDSGTVIGHDQFGRIKIRGNNGITYNIQDDPRWILPGGSKIPGPRHDYNDHPITPPAAANNATQSAPRDLPQNGGGAAGPFKGEWTVVSLDGQRYEPGAQNFNFVGSRYEILNQGSTMSGNFKVSGNSVQMISEDGSPFATFQYSMQGGQMILSAPGTKYVLVPSHK